MKGREYLGFSLSIILCAVLNLCHSLRILIYHDCLSASQMAFVGSLADILTQDGGHIVDQLIMEFNPFVNSNGSARLRHVFRVGIPRERNAFIQLGHISSPFSDGQFARRNWHFDQTRKELCAALLEDRRLLGHIRSARYDVYLTSVYLGCTFGYFHLVGNIPSMVGYSAIAGTDGLFPMLGIPEPASYTRSVLRPYGFGRRLPFWARLRNLLDHCQFLLGSNPVLDAEESLFHARFPGKFLPFQRIFRRLHYVFLNTNELLDMAKPQMAKIKHIGGITIEEQQKQKGKGKENSNASSFSAQAFPSSSFLPPQFNALLLGANASSKPFILFSFGSLVKTWQIPAQIELAIVRALCQFTNHTIIWKYDENAPGEEANQRQIREEAIQRAKECPNVLKFPWIPQRQLIVHPNVRLFISHLGLNSYFELASAGVPVLAIPLIGDQFYNAGCAIHKNGLGLLLEKTNLTEENLANSIREILQNPIYSKNARRLSRMLASGTSPRETFLKYVELAARHPKMANRHLQLASSREMGEWHWHIIMPMAFGIGTLYGIIKVILGIWRKGKRKWPNGEEQKENE